MTTIEILASLDKVIETNDRLKTAYLWHAPRKAKVRRDTEKIYSIPRFEFEFDGNNYSVSLNVSCSCAHVYVYRDYRRNGDKVDIRVLKNVYRKMYDSIYGYEGVDVV